MLHVEQIIEGDAQCQFCGDAAVVTMGNGADPEPEPLCVEHAREWFEFTTHAVVDLFGKKE